MPHGTSDDVQNLVVAGASTGAERRWVAPARDAQGSMGTMAWLADGTTLAFNWTGPAQTSASTGLRLLDTLAPGDNLLSGVTVLRGVNRAGSFDRYTISPDARTLFGIVGCLPGCIGGSTGTVHGHRDVLGSLIQFAAATKAATGPVYRARVPRRGGPPGEQRLHRPGLAQPHRAPGAAGLLPAAAGYRAAGGRTLTHILLLDAGKVTEVPWLAGPLSYQTAFPGSNDLRRRPGVPLEPVARRCARPARHEPGGRGPARQDAALGRSSPHRDTYMGVDQVKQRGVMTT